MSRVQKRDMFTAFIVKIHKERIVATDMITVGVLLLSLLLLLVLIQYYNVIVTVTVQFDLVFV